MSDLTTRARQRADRCDDGYADGLGAMREATRRMIALYSDIMKKTEIMRSVADPALVQELHDAPIQAERALTAAAEPDVDAYIAKLNASPGGEHA